MKVLVIVLGINAANSKFSYLYCEIEKKKITVLTWLKIRTVKNKNSIKVMKEYSKEEKISNASLLPPPPLLILTLT